jgi:hypothetical protein
MQTLRRFPLLALFLAVIFLPSLVLSDQLPTKVEKDILPGITYVTYGGQNFRFDTSVAIHVTFLQKAPNLIEMTFKVRSGEGMQSGPSSTSGAEDITILWENWNSTIYEGAPPSGEWVGMLNTESGFTEK